jgi:hypothetical protein
LTLIFIKIEPNRQQHLTEESAAASNRLSACRQQKFHLAAREVRALDFEFSTRAAGGVLQQEEASSERERRKSTLAHTHSQPVRSLSLSAPLVCAVWLSFDSQVLIRNRLFSSQKLTHVGALLLSVVESGGERWRLGQTAKTQEREIRCTHIVVEGLCLTRVLTCVPPLRRCTIQVPKYTESTRGFGPASD